MKQVIAMHGWSGDARAWGPWQRHFQTHGWSWQSGERGYGSLGPQQPDWQPDSNPESGQRRVVIGHSLGPHLLPEALLSAATDVVLLASFSQFVPTGRTGRALQTGLKGMRRCIGTTEEATMLQTFLTRAASPAKSSGLPPSPATEGLSPEGRQRLHDDLNHLMATAGLPAGLPRNAKVLVVNADADAIVIPAARLRLIEDLQRHLQHPPSIWNLKDSGHALLVPDLLLNVQTWLAVTNPQPAAEQRHR